MKKRISLVLGLLLFMTACTNVPTKEQPSFGLQPIKEFVHNQALVTYQTEFMAMEDGKVGVINQIGELVIDPLYQAMYITASGEYLGKKDNGYDLIRDHHIVSEFGKTMQILEENYDSYLYETSIGLWRVRKDGLRAYVDMQGNQLSATMFEKISPMSLPADDASIVASNLFYSYVAKGNQTYCSVHSLDGTMIVPPVKQAQDYGGGWSCHYDSISSWENGKNGRVQVDAVIYEVDKKYSVVLANGTLLLEGADQASFDWAEKGVRYEQEGKFYFVDFNGIVVPSEQNTVIGDYIVKSKQGYFGVEKKDGKVLLDYRYDSINPVIYAYDTNESYFDVVRNGKKYVVDLAGNELFSYTSANIRNTKNTNFWLAVDENWDYQLMDRKGNVLLNDWFSYFDIDYFVIGHKKDGYQIYGHDLSLIYESKQSYAFPSLGNLPYFLAKEGEQTVVKDEKANTVGNYLAHANDLLIYEKDGVISARSGSKQIVLDSFDSFSLEYASIQGMSGIFLHHQDKIHFFDFELNSYLQIEGQSIHHSGSITLEDYEQCQYFSVEKDGKFALMLESGEYLTGFDYDEIHYINEYGFVAVRNGSLWGVMNYRGELVVDYGYDAETLRNHTFGDGNYADTYYFIGAWHQVPAARFVDANGYYITLFSRADK